jgi:hypothetical protein
VTFLPRIASKVFLEPDRNRGGNPSHILAIRWAVELRVTPNEKAARFSGAALNPVRELKFAATSRWLFLRLFGGFVFQRGLRGGEARHRHAEG